MNLLKTALLLVLIAGAAVLGYLFLFKDMQPAQAFEAVQDLTPGDLEVRCGMPAQDTIGVVADGAGIRDLHYSKDGKDEIVFRFISTDNKSWESLGAWSRVNAPDFMGNPVNPFDAVRQMGCVARSGPLVLLPSPDSAVPSEAGTSGLAAELAAIVSPQAMQEMLMPNRNQGPPPMPKSLPSMPSSSSPSSSSKSNPWVVHSSPSLPSPPSAPSSSSSTQLDQWVVRMPAMSWESDGPDRDDNPRSWRDSWHCPAGADPCDVVDYSEFVAGMQKVIAAESNDQFQAAVDMLTRHGALFVRLPANEQRRVAAIQDVVRLEVKAFNMVQERLRNDVARLEPNSKDSADRAAKKMAEMQREDDLRRKLWGKSIEANRPSVTSSASGSVMQFNVNGYRRMVQIHVSGDWR